MGRDRPSAKALRLGSRQPRLADQSRERGTFTSMITTLADDLAKQLAKLCCHGRTLYSHVCPRQLAVECIGHRHRFEFHLVTSFAEQQTCLWRDDQDTSVDQRDPARGENIVDEDWLIAGNRCTGSGEDYRSKVRKRDT
jgi:hypothetical protein